MKDTQPHLKLKYSKVIKPRQRNIYVDELGRLHNEPVSKESVEYREYRETRKNIRGVTTPRKIQLYRWWFRYLQLSLELEELGVSLSEYRRVPKKGKTKGYDKKYTHKVKVNRKKYEGWDLDEVLTSNFDKWWKGHSHLFVESPTHMTEIKTPEEMVLDTNYRYFKVDTRMRTNEIVTSLRQQLEKKRRTTEWTSQWVPVGEVRQERLFNNYNTMVMWLQGKTTKEILTSGLFRKSMTKEPKYVSNSSSGGTQSSNLKYQTKTTYETNQKTGERIRKGSTSKKFEERNSKENLDAIRTLVVPSRRLILTVCDGYFAKHPRDKKYFGR
jgi:hypothetical protein